jgi:hypothetical protein
MSLDMSHGQPAWVCGEVIAHRDILRDHMEPLHPLATSSSGSAVPVCGRVKLSQE